MGGILEVICSFIKWYSAVRLGFLFHLVQSGDENLSALTIKDLYGIFWKEVDDRYMLTGECQLKCISQR